MECPHCGIDFAEEWSEHPVQAMRGLKQSLIPYMPAEGTITTQVWAYRVTACTKCDGPIVQLGGLRGSPGGGRVAIPDSWQRVFPRVGKMKRLDASIPEDFAQDCREAHLVLDLSAKASAALSRRCLQGILNAQGYQGGNLSQQIDRLLAETDTTKAIPPKLRTTVDAIRQFGNFSAHPITDQTTLQVIPVDPEEAEWCLEIVHELFDHFYVGPEIARQKKADLDRKLAAAGKPPSKG